jgi:hypothetical protein
MKVICKSEFNNQPFDFCAVKTVFKLTWRDAWQLLWSREFAVYEQVTFRGGLRDVEIVVGKT